MTLGEYVAKTKREVFEDIVAGREPRVGRYDERALADLRAKGEPQIGTSVLKPELVIVEYVFKLGDGGTEVFCVEVVPPERIVWLPVPEWVVESIWQGEVSGSYQFESHAREMLSRYSGVVERDENAKVFGVEKTIGKA